MKFKAIDENRRRFPVRMMCRLLQVSPSGFYASLKRPESRRSLEDRVLGARLVELHAESRGTYGSPRLQRALAEDGFELGRNRIQRLMRDRGIVGVHRRRFRSLTKQDQAEPVAPNVLGQDFGATRPNEKWVADITYIETGEGWLYLAIVLDLFSRAVVGWSMGETLHADLVLKALKMALGRRGCAFGLVHHSDRGSQYTSGPFRRLLDEKGITCSMSSTGSCFDNAAAESFFATLKTELVYRETFPTRDAARLALFDFIEKFYNRVRRHSALGQVSPLAFERAHQAALAA